MGKNNNRHLLFINISILLAILSATAFLMKPMFILKNAYVYPDNPNPFV
jgi:hypothetical protein